MTGDTITALTYASAFGGGVISFLSPCVLPIVPGYLSVITGLDAAELREGGGTRLVGVARDTGLFILGFGTVFVLLGLSATTIGSVVFDNQLLLTRLSGALLFGFALFLLGSLSVKAPWIYAEARFHPDLGRFGRAAPPVAGVAFGFGWTPCIGPVLGSILTIAATSGRATAGATLLAVYSLGLGLPFLITGLAFGRMTGALAAIRRRLPAIVVASSIVMAVFGLLLMLNQLTWVTAQMSTALDSIGLGYLVTLG